MTEIRAVLFDFGGVFTASPFGALDVIGEKTGADPKVLMEVVFGPYHEDTDHPWHRLERERSPSRRRGRRSWRLAPNAGVEADPFQVFAAIGSTGGARDALVDRVRKLRPPRSRPR